MEPRRSGPDWKKLIALNVNIFSSASESDEPAQPSRHPAHSSSNKDLIGFERLRL